MKRILSVLICFLASATSVAAVTITLNDVPANISGEPFTVSATISGASTGTNYLRVDLFKNGTTNYFGETWNDVSWYGGSSGPAYKPISIVSGIDTMVDVTAKVGSPSASQYTGSGAYKLRVRRYTSSGNVASGDAQIPADVNIDLVLPSPTVAPEPTTTPTPMATPTSTPEPTPTPSLNPTLTPVPTQKPIIRRCEHDYDEKRKSEDEKKGKEEKERDREKERWWNIFWKKMKHEKRHR